MKGETRPRRKEYIVTTAESTIRACACGNYTFVTDDGDVHAQCMAPTKKQFAPGHDARLKGQLIRHGVEGNQVRLASGELVSPQWVADQFGFGPMVRKGIERRLEKLSAKSAKVEAEPVADVPAEPEVVEAKVGRWTYQGHLTEDGFAYQDKKGQTKVVPEGQFALVANAA
jgi:hypothetical protein